MIMKAISDLDEKEGSNKTAISGYIESNYGDLPEAHQTLLIHHLNLMKESGELAFAKNNYSKPDPNAPPKRGRGRPPKPKDPLASPSSNAPASRGRGRPPKDPNAPPKPPKPAGSGRPRGRPRKIPRVADDEVADPPSAMSAGTGRSRGRPPKVKPADAAVAEVSVQN
ncbi:HMG-Y-related protein A [Linum perenne]